MAYEDYANLHEWSVEVDQHVENAESEGAVDRTYHTEHVDAAHHGQAREPRVNSALSQWYIMIHKEIQKVNTCDS